MATIKAVSSKAGIGTVINYVSKEEKTEEKLLSGINCQPETAEAEMQATKELWNKMGGRTYKHFVQSFHPDETITPEEAHRIACELVPEIEAWKGFEVLIATHQDKEHIHTHFIVNSVNIEDGHKLQWSKRDLQDLKDRSDELCRKNNLHICEKGKTFEGAEREEVSAYTKEAYRILKQAEQGEVKSYVQDIAVAVFKCKEKATSKEDFIDRMNDQGYEVSWEDNHKYITFTDLTRQEQGDKKCKIRNNKLEKYYNMDFGKESMLNEFEINARREQVRRDFHGFESTGTAEREDSGAFIGKLNAAERVAEKERDNKISERANRDAERERQRIEEQRTAQERERAAQERKARSIERSRRSGPSL